MYLRAKIIDYIGNGHYSTSKQRCTNTTYFVTVGLNYVILFLCMLIHIYFVFLSNKLAVLDRVFEKSIDISIVVAMGL